MAQYTIEAPDGRRVTIEGDSEPTESDLVEIFNSLPAAKTAQEKPSVGGEALKVAGQFGSGILFDLPNIGAKPIAELIGGQPLASMEKGVLLAGKSREVLDRFMKGGLPTASQTPVEQDTLNSKYGFPVVPQPETEVGKVLGLGANIAGQAVAGKALTSAMTNIPKMLPNLSKAEAIFNETADKTAINGRSVVKDYMSDLSKAYGDEYRPAIKGVTINQGDYVRSLEMAAEKNGLFQKDSSVLSPSEKNFLSYLEGQRAELPKQSPIDSILNKQDAVKESFKSLESIDDDLLGLLGKKYGKAWGSGEHILTDVRSAITEALGDSADALKVVKAKFKDPLQMKNEAVKIFQPFNRSGSYDTTSATNFLKLIAGGGGAPDEMRMVEKLTQYRPGVLDELIKKSSELKSARTISNLIKTTGGLGVASALGAFGRLGWKAAGAISGEK